jgi:hypothetical protein
VGMILPVIPNGLESLLVGLLLVFVNRGHSSLHHEWSIRFATPRRRSLISFYSFQPGRLGCQ